MRTAHLAVPLACALAVALLCALGIWQLGRREWKLALIARVEARIHAAPVAAPPRAEWPLVSHARDEYRHVELRGRWLAAQATLVAGPSVLGSGWWQLVPLQQDDGGVVLVNRGFLSRPVAGVPDLAGADATVVVRGLLRISEPGGSWLRRNDPQSGRWYSRDVAAIARARGLAGVAPYFVDAEAPGGAPDARVRLAQAGEGEQIERGDSDRPVPGLTVVAFPNDHLAYALTWFALALLVALGGLLWAREEQAANSPNPPAGPA